MLNAISGALDELERLENDDAETEGLTRTFPPSPTFPAAGSGLGASDRGESERRDSTEASSFVADASVVGWSSVDIFGDQPIDGSELTLGERGRTLSWSPPTPEKWPE